MIVRQPSIQDVDRLYDFILPYADISLQGKAVPISLAQVADSLINVLNAENFVVRMAEQNGEVVGLAFGHYCNTWWAEPDCDVSFLYGKPGTGRFLVAAMIDGFKELGCGWMYAGAESGISESNTKLYQNLFKKFGFQDIGGGRMLLNLRGK